MSETTEVVPAEKKGARKSAPTFDTAFAQAQQEFTAVVKNKVNPFLKNNYADLNSVINAVRPALLKHNISIRWQYATDQVMGLCVDCILSGHGSELHSGPLPLGVSGGSNAMQAIGSASSYARRYTLMAVCGVAADDDDDGNKASPQHKDVVLLPLSEKEALPILEAARNGGREGFKQFMSQQSDEFKSRYRATEGLGRKVKAIADGGEA